MNHSLHISLHLSFPIIKGCVISRRVSHSTPRRRHLRRRLKDTSTSSPPSDLQFILNVDDLPSKSFKDLVDSKVREFIGSSQAAFEDLQTLIRVDSTNGRVVFSCRRSTVNFLGTILATSFVVIFTLTAVFKLLLLGFRMNNGHNNAELLVYKRDRSLGGREVLVAKRDAKPDVPITRQRRRRRRKSSVENLPKWWPLSASASHQVEVENQDEYQRRANRLIRESPASPSSNRSKKTILDNRMTGKDILEDDIIQLRRIGRLSGVKVSFDTENARDTLYRMAIDFVLNYCESNTNQSAFVLIDGEEAQKFVAGLADNVGLESTRAARMVSAAVAARTRSRFLQAWALEIQGKPSEAVVELFKICVIHQIFPPEEYSPEMEMVARGLEKHLKVDQREFLMNTLLRACGDETRRSVAEALGLMYSKDDIVHQQENKST